MDNTHVEEAIAWHERQRQETVDWDGFTAWLEADPDHRTAYDQVALLDDMVQRHRSALARELPAASGGRSHTLRRRWLTAAAATATVAAALAVVSILPLRTAAPVSYATGPGETRSITLADGSQVEMAPGTRLVIAGRHATELSLTGSAYFDIRHLPGRNLVVHAGGFDIQDIGTRFEVATGHGGLRVAVARGRVSVQAGDRRQTIRLEARQRLLVTDRGNKTEVAQIQTEDVASWRQGRLVYQNAPLSLVTADISRYSGKLVTVDPSIAGRRFSGVLTIGDGSELVGNLQQFMGLGVRAEGDSVRFIPRDD